MPTERVLERVIRESSRKLLAFLAARSGDLAAAEDALGEALCAALMRWPQSGIPASPEAWLLTAARRQLIDQHRHDSVRARAAPDLLAAADQAMNALDGQTVFPDERLKLMFVCTHPAIDPGARTPLMLQTVLGLEAADIAAAFLLKPATMGQRLSRAKNKIRLARIPFDIPEAKALPERLEAVLEAIYGIYGIGWEDAASENLPERSLVNEALELGELLIRLLPEQAEPQGLLALMRHCEARRPTRRDAQGRYVPLSEQPTGRWLKPLIDDADRLLANAAALQQPGRFQLEAAIQSVHNRRLITGRTDWPSIAALYDGLASLAPTLGVLVARAAARAEVDGADVGLELLATLPKPACTAYQPYWALKARLLAKQGQNEAARTAFEEASRLSQDAACRAFLQQQAGQLD
ncbi:MAG: RNA polymerase subunit sigma-70 [Rhodocyclales bacterium GT-UBC]|nr:MAG: RNA polymerase subunit sigma-70 [Rhodocyclales bacterium GT-UBC]